MIHFALFVVALGTMSAQLTERRCEAEPDSPNVKRVPVLGQSSWHGHRDC
jgi:hypothetical protein